jgi:hypothetical protein
MGQALADAGFSDAGGFEAAPEPSSAPDDASTSSVEATHAPGQPAATPTESPETAESPTTPGPLPFEAHKRILDGAYAERDALKAKYEAVAWAHGIPPDKAQEIAAFVQDAAGNPVEFFLRYADRLLQHPEHAAAIRSHAARTLGRRDLQSQPSPATSASVENAPPPPTMEIDGMALFSTADLAKRDAWLQQQLVQSVTSVVGEQLAPLTSLQRELTTAQERQQAEARAQSTAKSVLDDATQWPGFNEHKTKLAEALTAEMQSGRWKDEEVGHALRHLYITTVVPTLMQNREADTVRKLRTQALTGPSPNGHAPAAAPSPHVRPTWSTVFQTV